MQKLTRRIRCAWKLVAPLMMGLAFCWGTNRAAAQATTATLVGTVTDSSGAVVTHAKVTMTEQNTGQVYSLETNESGNYEFTLMRPGVYSVKVTSPGFQGSVTENVPATVNTTTRTDVALKPGSETQTVTVTDAPPALQTDRADVSAQIETKQVADLPVGNIRNFQALESLVPGVSAPIYDHSSFFNAQNSQSFQVNGQAETTNNLQLEGIDDNERTGLLQVYIPPAAAIQTVDVETSNYAPEFGRAAGAVTNVVLKSGTNQFHGSAYEYNEVSATGARNYFNQTGKFPRFTNNYYGATIGGPIFKDRTFFFGDFLRYSNHSSVFNQFILPTAAFRNGDLSASPTKIYDPATGHGDPSKRAQFPGNQIPSTRFNAVAVNILSLVPLPNIPDAPVGKNNFQENLGFDQDSTSFDIKVDQRLLARDHLSFRYSDQRVDTTQAPAFGAAGGPANNGFQGTGSNHTYNTAGEYTHAFSLRLLTAARVGVNHYRNNARQTDYGTNASDAIGIPGVNVSPFTSGLAGISVPGYAGATSTASSPLVGYSASIPWDRGESNIDAANSWIDIVGNHSLKFGFEIRRVRDDLTQGQTFSPRGIFQFAEGQTGNSSDQNTSFGNDFASFLLDLPNLVGRDVNVGSASWRQTLYFAYAQDTWQATKSLTLTCGLRWEIYPPPTPKYPGGFSQYDPSDNTLHVAGYGSVPLNLGLPLRATDFEPRLGLAYRVGPGTVMRAGFGISHTPFQDNNYAFNYPVRQNVSFNANSSYTPAIDKTTMNVATFEYGFPTPPAPKIPPDGIIQHAQTTSVWTVVNPDYKDPYVMSFNAAIQQDLGDGWVADFAYVGNLGRQIPAYYNLNAGLIAGAGSKGQPENAPSSCPLDCRTAATNLMGKGTNSSYNGLQVKLTRRFQNGLSWTSGFAWQKSLGFISTGSGLDHFNFYLDPERDYARLNWDRRVTYAQSFIYELPFGANRRYLQHGPAAVVLGGWQVSTVMSAISGTPLFLTASSKILNAPGNTQVPNQIAPFHKLGSIARQWFDTNAFVPPPTPAYGNTPKNAYSGPGLVTLDGSLMRAIPLHESINLQLRADAFNLMNHPTFANPGTSLTSANFGQITSTANGSSPTPNQRVLQFAARLSF